MQQGLHRNSMRYGSPQTNVPNVNNCRNCGLNHLKGQCPAYGTICKACQKYNHYASMCRGQKQYQRAQYNSSVTGNNPLAGQNSQKGKKMNNYNKNVHYANTDSESV